MQLKQLILVILIACCYYECSQEKSITAPAKGERDTSVRHARRFSISRYQDYKIIYLFGNRHNFDTTAAFILFSGKPPVHTINIPAIKVPCNKIAALSSIYAAMLGELDATDNIAAIDNIDYVNNAKLIKRFNEIKMPELARTPDIDVELTISLEPDIVFTYGMGDGRDLNQKLQQAGIPVAVSVDHLETSPLARAEWIKFFGAFVAKDSVANEIFKKVEQNYLQIKALAASTYTKPKVFSEIKFGDTWYMPGGRSYVSKLLTDANADYLWKNDTMTGSLPLSFEQVYARAKEADFWINLSTVTTRVELLGYELRYSEFKAYKNRNLYNNNKVANAKGYSIYWETGMIYPNRILSDMAQIFHPELKASIKNDLYYYRQLK